MSSAIRAAALLGLSACAPSPSPNSSSAAVSRPVALSELTRKPELINGAEVYCDLLAIRSHALRYAGSGGSAVLHLTVGANGRVDAVHLERTSGAPALDRVLERLANRMRFRPGQVGRAAVPTEFTLPLALEIQDLGQLPRLPGGAPRSGCG